MSCIHLEMLSCVIIDDDIVAAEVLKTIVNKNSNLKLEGVYDGIPQSASFLAHNQVDLLFLDIEMPEMSGLDFVKSNRDVPQVIFTTSHKEFAVEAFEYDVTDYLVKPISKERFDKAIAKANSVAELKKLAESTVEKLTIKDGGSLLNLAVNDILYIEAYGDYVKIITRDKKHVVLNTMNNIQSNLPDDSFMRVHRSYTVNINQIDRIEDYTIILSNSDKISVSKRNKVALKKKLVS